MTFTKLSAIMLNNIYRRIDRAQARKRYAFEHLNAVTYKKFNVLFEWYIATFNV